MVISSDTRIKIRGTLTGLGFVRTGYTQVTTPGGEYTETWTNGQGESVDISWGGYPVEEVTDVRTEDKSAASPIWGNRREWEPTDPYVSHA